MAKRPETGPENVDERDYDGLVIYHVSGFYNFKHFYIYYVQVHMQKEFPRTVSYNRFVELMQEYSPTGDSCGTCRLGDCTGISFVDSTPVRVCTNKRISNNKVFDRIATTGKSTMDGFTGSTTLSGQRQRESARFCYHPGKTWMIDNP